MVSTLCLMACALATSQTADWPLHPRLSRGQELVYSGSYTDESLTGGPSLQRAFKVDTNVLVLEAGTDKFDLAVLTIVTSKSAQYVFEPGRSPAPPSSVRLEVISIDRQGKILSPHAIALAAPLDGPPTVECGLFPELPKSRIGPRSTWDVNEDGRTPRTWQVEDTESVNSVHCVRLTGIQQSDDWNTPRADRASWQRIDTLWVSPQSGLTCRYKRVIDRRDPARQTPTNRTTLTCELDGGLTYHGKLLEDRLREINQARKLSKDAESWLHEPTQHKVGLENILKKIKQHCDTEPPTPFRRAVIQVQKRIEAALRGEAIPNPDADAVKAQASPASTGQRIPDFICTDLLTRQTLRLQKVLGKPVLVAFFSPATENGRQVLQLGHSLASRYPKGLSILPMAISDDPEQVRKQHGDMKLPFSIYDGKGLLQPFGVDALPRIVLLDDQGVVHQAWTGWGLHTPAEVGACVQELIRR